MMQNTRSVGRRNLLAVAASGALLAASACGTTSGATSGEDCAAPTVGVVLSMTGPVAVYGTEEKKAIQLAVKHLEKDGGFGDKKPEFKYEDERSEQSSAVQAFERLIFKDEADVIIGAGFSSAMLAAGPIAQKAKVPVVGPATTADAINEIGDYVMRVGLSDSALMDNAVPVMLEEVDASTAAIIYAHDDDAQTNGTEVVKGILKDEGIDVVQEQTFNRGEKDVAAQATKITNANPDVTFVMGYQEDAGNIIATMTRLGYEGDYIGSPAANGSATVEGAGKAAEGLMVPGWWSADADDAASKEFVADFEDAYGATPTGYAGMAYLDAMAVGEAIKKADCADAEGIKEALYQVEFKDSIVGEFSFGEDGDADFKPVIMEVKNGKLISSDVQP